MDLETEPLEEQRKDEHCHKDTLNERIENEVGNISNKVHDFRAVSTSMKGKVNWFQSLYTLTINISKKM